MEKIDIGFAHIFVRHRSERDPLFEWVYPRANHGGKSIVLCALIMIFVRILEQKSICSHNPKIKHSFDRAETFAIEPLQLIPVGKNSRFQEHESLL